MTTEKRDDGGPRLSDRERKALGALADVYDDGYCLYFNAIAEQAGLDRTQARRACRSLARKGLAEYVRGLFDEDGMVAGSGYRCTKAGRMLAERAKAGR